jgi:hypothetical protein
LTGFYEREPDSCGWRYHFDTFNLVDILVDDVFSRILTLCENSFGFLYLAHDSLMYEKKKALLIPTFNFTGTFMGIAR